MSNYFVKNPDGKERGPYSSKQLKQYVADGRVHPTDAHIRKEGSENWHSIKSVKGLVPPAQSQTVKTPPPAETAEVAIYLPARLQSGPVVADLVDDSGSFELDESRIFEVVKEKYQTISNEIQVIEQWRTPAGNQRQVPVYEAAISSGGYLGKHRTIRKASYEELLSAIDSQMNTWMRQEFREKTTAANKELQESAESHAKRLNKKAITDIQAIKSILEQGVTEQHELNWADFVDHSRFPEFEFEGQPSEPPKPTSPREPRKNLLQTIFPFLWTKTFERHQSDVRRWQSRLKSHQESVEVAQAEWSRRRATAHQEYQQKHQQFATEQQKRNQAVALFQEHLRTGTPKVLERYLEEVLASVRYPETLPVEHSIGYVPESQTILADLVLPLCENMTNVTSYKFVKTKRESRAVVMKDKDHKALYDTAINQIVLRVLYAVFDATEDKFVQGAVVNGWVTYVDPATGHEETSCVVTISSTREKLNGINLSKVDPAKCLADLKGIVAGPLSSIVPVKPILQLDREDSRFVESRETLAEINATTNLAELGWEEFEHLVRELFQTKFAEDGAEVKVTQASSDGGVDAIALDPDPIRGGKFVIQAKRYTNVVPVAAVRDLYGTMMNEGASRGILVTTAHYGAESLAFAENKPITLINGNELVYMLEEIGHQVRVDPAAAKAKAGWNPLKR